METTRIKVKACDNNRILYFACEAAVESGNISKTNKPPYKVEVIEASDTLIAEDFPVLKLEDILSIEKTYTKKGKVLTKRKPVRPQWGEIVKKAWQVENELAEKREKEAEQLLQSGMYDQKKKDMLLPKLTRLLNLQEEVEIIREESAEVVSDVNLLYTSFDTAEGLLNEIIESELMEDVPDEDLIAEALIDGIDAGLSLEKAAKDYIKNFKWIKQPKKDKDGK